MPRRRNTPIALLLALVLPLCCCNLRLGFGVGACEGTGSCAASSDASPAGAKSARHSCCRSCSSDDSGASKSPDSPPPVDDGCTSKLCCVKGGPMVAPFQVPVDQVGTPLVLPADMSVVSAASRWQPEIEIWPPGRPPTLLSQHTLLLV